MQRTNLMACWTRMQVPVHRQANCPRSIQLSAVNDRRSTMCRELPTGRHQPGPLWRASIFVWSTETAFSTRTARGLSSAPLSAASGRAWPLVPRWRRSRPSAGWILPTAVPGPGVRRTPRRRHHRLSATRRMPRCCARLLPHSLQRSPVLLITHGTVKSECQPTMGGFSEKRRLKFSDQTEVCHTRYRAWASAWANLQHIPLSCIRVGMVRPVRSFK